MDKNSLTNNLIPIPTQVTAPVTIQQVSLDALRRQKVRELHRQGFDARRISMILNKGVKGKDGKTIYFDNCSSKKIKEDIQYITQEEMAEDKDYLVKRVELLGRLHYLYNQAMISYRNAKERNPVKATFLRTAVDILNRISELEGLGVEKGVDKISRETQTSYLADEVRKLPKEDRDAIESTVTKILSRSEQQKSKRSEVLPEKSRVLT